MAPSHLSDRPLVICEVLISSRQECTTFRRRMGLYRVFRASLVPAT